MRPLVPLLLWSCVYAAAARSDEPGVHQARPGPEQSAALTASILAQDQALFAAIFDDCDTAKLAGLVTADLEFFHDKHGQTAETGTQMVESIRGMCQRQAEGSDYRARRELDRASVQVYPMNHYGAVQTGVHRFYMLEPGKPEKLVEISRFTILWKQQEDGRWQMARAISFDHRTTE